MLNTKTHINLFFFYYQTIQAYNYTLILPVSEELYFLSLHLDSHFSRTVVFMCRIQQGRYQDCVPVSAPHGKPGPDYYVC